jgi:phenylpyruvate tautomerase PptA (4-oxalocrotonate tautomerase family)
VKELPKETTSQKKANANKGAKQKVAASVTEAVASVADKLKETKV